LSQTLDRLANNVQVTLLARAMQIIGIPIAGAILFQAWGAFVEMRDASKEMKWQVTAIQSRLEGQENVTASIQSELRARTADRFTKSDAGLLEQSIRRDINRIENQVGDVRRQVDDLRTITLKQDPDWKAPKGQARP